MTCPKCRRNRFMRTEKNIVWINKTLDIDVNGTQLVEYRCMDCSWSGARSEIE